MHNIFLLARIFKKFKQRYWNNISHTQVRNISHAQIKANHADSKRWTASVRVQSPDPIDDTLAQA